MMSTVLMEILEESSRMCFETNNITLKPHVNFATGGRRKPANTSNPGLLLGSGRLETCRERKPSGERDVLARQVLPAPQAALLPVGDPGLSGRRDSLGLNTGNWRTLLKGTNLYGVRFNLIRVCRWTEGLTGVSIYLHTTRERTFSGVQVSDRGLGQAVAGEGTEGPTVGHRKHKSPWPALPTPITVFGN